MQIVIAGGGPAGAICARTLAKSGIRAIMIEASPHGRKPCAGGLPSILVEQYSIPDLLIKSKTDGVTFQAPSGLKVNVNFPPGLYIATVERQEFDSHLRWSAEDAGATMFEGRVVGYEEKGHQIFVHYKGTDGNVRTTECDFLVGADGVTSRVARQAMGRQLASVVAVQEEIQLLPENIAKLENRCLFDYTPEISPDFYGWIFPKGDLVSIGVGTVLSNREAVSELLETMKKNHADLIGGGRMIRRNGALIPTEQYKEHGQRRVLLAGDAAGFVLPASGEGIYFAMRSGEIAAETIVQFIKERPDLVVSKYTDRVNAEFNPIFRYFRKIQRITYKNTLNRETVIRLSRNSFMSNKVLKAFASKEHVPTPLYRKFLLMFEIIRYRMEAVKALGKK